MKISYSDFFLLKNETYQSNKISVLKIHPYLSDHYLDAMHRPSVSKINQREVLDTWDFYKAKFDIVLSTYEI